MSEFDRALATCLGATLASGPVSRDAVASCYRQTLQENGGRENESVTEKWIDYVWEQVRELPIAGQKPERIAKMVFEKIAKS